MAELKSIETIQKAGTAAVKRLRKQKFARGLPFMINSGKLPQDQSYLEYPDGKMVIIQLSHANNNFIIIAEIPDEISITIRHQFHLD